MRIEENRFLDSHLRQVRHNNKMTARNICLMRKMFSRNESFDYINLSRGNAKSMNLKRLDEVDFYYPHQKYNFRDVDKLMMIKPGVIFVYYCEYCEKKYNKIKNLLKHQKSHKPMGVYKCICSTGIFNSFHEASVHWKTNCDWIRKMKSFVSECNILANFSNLMCENDELHILR
jgi:hypothetical protein